MKLSVLLVVLVTAVLAPLKIQAQQHQARDWHCVRQPMVEDTDGNVLTLQCEAALPKGEKLDAEDEDTLSKLDRIRYNAQTFTSVAANERANEITKGDQSPKRWSLDTGKGQEMMDAVRMGFGQKVGQICQKHPDIVLAPLFPDLTTAKPMLYGCKNIIASPEK
jgi:hypothetical protein